MTNIEYVVMRAGDDQDPHRRPFIEQADDRFGGPPMTADQQRSWCEKWVRDCTDMGIRDGAFYVASRTVTAWQPVHEKASR